MFKLDTTTLFTLNLNNPAYFITVLFYFTKVKHLVVSVP